MLRRAAASTSDRFIRQLPQRSRLRYFEHNRNIVERGRGVFEEPGFYVLALLVVANLVLIGCLLRALAAQQGAAASLAVGLDARLGGLDRNDEALRRSVTEMDQALRREIATG